MRSVKPFLSINEQIKLLKSRGLSITDSQYNCAEQFLLNNNYYRISGYSLTLRKNNTFFNSASLETLMQIYEADRHMRHIILSIVETVETRIKSMVAYYHSEKYNRSYKLFHKRNTITRDCPLLGVSGRALCILP